VTITFVAALASLLVAAPAQAAAGDRSYVLDQTNVRVCGSTRWVWCGKSYNGVIGVVWGDQLAQTWCWRDGEEALGTVRWFKITAWITNGTYQEGWVSAARVTRQASVPWCSSWQ
jgi:hypothetical protein